MKTFGRFEILAQVGAGGMGVVYKAHDPSLARTVALKVLSPALTRDRAARDRQLNEARAAAALTHSNIATVYEIVSMGDTHAIVMEFVDGESLYERVRRDPPPLERAVTWARQMTDGIAAAHEAGVIHRDIKSNNIMITRNERAKVLDFGVARRLASGTTADDATRLTRAGSLVGTMGYIAPEVLSGEDASVRSDVFSLGVVLFETITGRQPFEAGAAAQVMYQVINQAAPRMREFRTEVPDALEAIVQRAMSKEAGARYASAREMLEDLETVGAGDGGRLRAARTAAPSNLPAPTTRFIGREKELGDLTARLAEARLITITGPGGAGKTRASLELARRVGRNFPDGTFLVELAPIEESGRVLIAIARALGLREDPAIPLMETVTGHLENKQILLLLDNCEHLINTIAGAAVQIMQSAPAVKVIATSQERLGVPGEVVWQIPSLSLPSASVASPIELTRYEAVRLFVDRATQVKTGFLLDERNASAVVQICRQLDGIPLAIELAAARVRMLTPQVLLERLEDRFRFLTDGNRTSLPRQQTLRATVAWSVDLLEENERLLFSMLSVFSGGMSLDAVEGLCAGMCEGDDDLLDLLGRLVDKSLVIARETPDGEPRYHILETLRAYGREMLQKNGNFNAAHDRHAAFFLDLVERAEPELGGSEQVKWFDLIEREADNGRAMLAWYIKNGDYEPALRVGAAVWRFWLLRGYLRSGRDLLARILSETSEPTETRARALLGAGMLATDQGDYEAAREHFEECMAIRRERGDRAGLSHVLNSLGIAARDQGKYDEARRLLGEGLDISRELSDRSGVANALMALGITAHREGDCARANELFEEALKIRTALRDQRGIAALDAHLGGVAFDLGDFDRAEPMLERALVKFQELGNKRGIVFARIYLGGVAQQRHDYARARELFVECLVTSRELGDKQHIVRSLECMAGLAAANGNYERALELDGAAQALRETFGARRTPIEQRMLEKALAPAAEIMRESGIRRTRAAGRSRLLDAVIELALEENGA